MNAANTFLLPDWARAYGCASGTGAIKTEPDDFFVEEIPAFTPEGSGEHVFVFLEKRGENTEYVARLLARFAGVRQRDIGVAGMKDRQARTRQWFSVWLPGKDEPDWAGLNSETVTVLQTVRHARKLKRGVLAGNQFGIRIRDFHGDAARLNEQLQAIKQHGFPNYFGGQRFGHSGYNLDRALAMFAGLRVKPEQQSLYLSAARAFLFNEMLARRVENQTWNQPLAGDMFKLAGSNSHFYAAAIDEELLARCQTHDIHPAAVLWGKGDFEITGAAKIIEEIVIAEYVDLAAGLIKFGLEKDYRALRVIPEHLTWLFESPEQVYLTFTLPAGSFATALLREIITTPEH